MPEDLSPGYALRKLIEEFGGQGSDPTGPTYPGDTTREDFFEILFGHGDSPPGGDGPDIPNTGGRPSVFIDQLLEELDSEFPDTGPGPAVPPRPLSIQEILEDRLNGHTGFASPAPEPKDIEPEWEGNVPPDLTDGFDFLL